MTTKQSQQIQPEEISEELLLRSWNKTLEVVTECNKINKESGVLDPDRFVEFTDTLPMKIIKYNNWIDACINPKNGKPYTLESLISSGVINEDERRFYPSEVYPLRELMSMSRVQAVDKSEWLVRNEMWYGLYGKSGAINNMTVDTLDYYKKIVPTYTTEAIDPTRKGTKQVRVAKIGRCLPWYEGARKTYTNPFSLESVNAAMRDTQKPTIDPTISNTTLYLVRDGVTACTSIPISELDRWVTGDFDTLFDKRLNQNQNQNQNDIKELVSQLKQQSSAAGEHYQ